MADRNGTGSGDKCAGMRHPSTVAAAAAVARVDTAVLYGILIVLGCDWWRTRMERARKSLEVEESFLEI